MWYRVEEPNKEGDVIDRVAWHNLQTTYALVVLPNNGVGAWKPFALFAEIYDGEQTPIFQGTKEECTEELSRIASYLPQVPMRLAYTDTNPFEEESNG